MYNGMGIAQFTAGSTARRTLVQFGYVPDHVVVYADHTGTNPNIMYWFNKGGQTLPAGMQVGGPTPADPQTSVVATATAPDIISQWLDADDHILDTGSTGVLTRVTTGIKAYFGGDVIAADETINSNPVHPFTNGGFPKAGEITMAGIELPAAILTADKLYIVCAWRRDPDQRVGGLVV